MRRLLPLLLFAATVCFTLGIALPLIRMERLFLFTDEPSLAAMLFGLWAGGDMLLAATVGLFSIVFPALKLGLPLGEYPLVALENVGVAGIFGRAWDTLRLWLK